MKRWKVEKLDSKTIQVTVAANLPYLNVRNFLFNIQ
jgi:hypothetical protein